jgi:hypothetical protein
MLNLYPGKPRGSSSNQSGMLTREMLDAAKRVKDMPGRMPAERHDPT